MDMDRTENRDIRENINQTLDSRIRTHSNTNSDELNVSPNEIAENREVL